MEPHRNQELSQKLKLNLGEPIFSLKKEEILEAPI